MNINLTLGSADGFQIPVLRQAFSVICHFKPTYLTPNDKTLRIVLLAIFGTWFTFKLFKTAEENFFLDGIILLVIGIVGLLILIWTIRKDFKEYKKTQKLTSYFPTFIGLLFILTNIGLFYYQDQRTNSPTLISGFSDGGFNGFSVDFKTDGNYVMANGSGLGQSNFYGKYNLKDSIIIIDKSNIDNCIKTNRLVIRTEEYFSPTETGSTKKRGKYITQIDKNGNEIDKEFRFRVRQDNRNK